MKYYRFERQGKKFIDYWVSEYLTRMEVDRDCVVTYAIAKSGKDKDHITAMGNLTVTVKPMSNGHYSYTRSIIPNVTDEDVLLIYGHTLIDEVVMIHGVV